MFTSRGDHVEVRSGTEEIRNVKEISINACQNQRVPAPWSLGLKGTETKLLVLKDCSSL